MQPDNVHASNVGAQWPSFSCVSFWLYNARQTVLLGFRFYLFAFSFLSPPSFCDTSAGRRVALFWVSCLVATTSLAALETAVCQWDITANASGPRLCGCC